MKQATDGCSVLMCLQHCYGTTSNSVVNYQDIFSVKFCAQCESSRRVDLYVHFAGILLQSS